MVMKLSCACKLYSFRAAHDGFILLSIIMREAGASRATYSEAIGYNGIIQGDEPSPWPGKFYAEAAMVFPSI